MAGRHGDADDDVTIVGVLGPGAVGGALAVKLAQADLRVICIAPTDTARAIRSEGLTLRHGSGVLTARPEAVERLDEAVALLLVTVKAPALDDALDRIAVTPAVTLPLLNGLEHVGEIRRRLAGRVIAGSIGRLEAYRTAPTEIVQTTSTPVISVAELNGAADLMRLGGFDVRVGESEAAVLWEKLVRLAPLAAATTITQQTLGDLRSDSHWRGTLEKAVAEAVAAALADGVVLNEAAQWDILDSMPATVTTSTARDAAAGRRTELDAIVGAVVRAAHRKGVDVPTLERLLTDAEAACQAPSR